MTSNITLVVTTLTLISHAVFIFGLLLMLVEGKFRAWIYSFVNKYVLELVFAASLSATLGSLAYSNIVGFPPCELCWFQRILMYPQALLSLMALIKKDKNIVSYLLPISVLGALVSFYHSLVHWGIGTSLLACTANGGECGKVYVLAYNYITIPFMSFTVFVYLIAISLIYLKSKNVEQRA